jgi:ribosomal protein S12 methylthiotransferase
MQGSKGTIKVVTLGCAKNEVDSEEIAGVLAQDGYSVDGSSKKSDVTIINTCGFLESAKEESLRAIKQALREKKAGKTGRVIVAGCLAQRMGDELKRLVPDADLIVGVGQMSRFDKIVAETLERPHSEISVTPPQHLWAEVGTRARSGKPWSAYLKVSEGCDHQCTFCTIPSFRGKHQSKPIERIIEEARHLARRGVREINLIAQDVTQYGYDLYKKFTLPTLLKQLNDIEGIEWIRILYFYPNRLTDEVIETMASCEHVLPYIDIPLQHTHPDVLRRMKRPWDGDRYLKLFEKVRAAMPEVAIRTTFIVGFPGETDEEFEHILDFLKAARLDRVGAFEFSREPGTPSYDMPNQVSNKVRKSRYDKLMRTQQGISLERNKEWIGKSIRVLVEETRDGWLVGRSHRDAPEIDGLVFSRGNAEPGSLVDVKIESAEPYDLYGSVEGQSVVAPRRLTGLRMANPKAPQ